MKKIIVLIKGDEVEAFTTLTGLCIHHKDFSYHYIKRKSKFPYLYKGWIFYKINLK